MAAVSLASISKSFGKTDVLHDIDITIESGEFLSVLGPSGCGKTTLLRILAGLESVSRGSVSIAGVDVTGLPPEKRNIAMMFQSYALLPNLSVAENVRFPLRMRRMGSTAEQYDKVDQALGTVQLSHLKDRKPRQLSGGQQQRVALARAIVSNPEVLLLDEPLSNLDAQLREEMQIELIELHRKLNLTTVFVTHDQEEALSLSDRIILLNAGRIEQQGSPDSIYLEPASAFVSRFMGSANIIPVAIRAQDQSVIAEIEEGYAVNLSDSVTHRGAAQLSVRQEDISLRPADSGLKPGELLGRVQTRVFLGARNRFLVQVGGRFLRVLAPAGSECERGQAVAVSMDPACIRVLPA